MARGTTTSRVITVWTTALAAVLLLDAAIFRTKFYPSRMEPVSAAGWLELRLRRELEGQKNSGDNLILTMGNSRFAYSPVQANQVSPPSGYIFRNAGVAGSNPRGWYYMLRDLDPEANRYRAIVFGVDDYNDNSHRDQADYTPDLHQLINRLRWSDVLDFPWSFREPENRWAAFRGSILKGTVYQRDFQAFLEHPSKRMKDIGLNIQFWEQSQLYDYSENQNTVVGLQIDWKTKHIVFPSTMNADQRDLAEIFIRYQPVPQPGLAEYKRYWFGRMLDRYKGSRTKIVFVRLPRAPIPHPDLPFEPHSALRELAGRPNVFLTEEHAFEYLEHPELFSDYLHLNHDGVTLFTPRLVEIVTKTIGRPD